MTKQELKKLKEKVNSHFEMFTPNNNNSDIENWIIDTNLIMKSHFNKIIDEIIEQENERTDD